MSTHKLCNILKSVDSVTEEQARQAIDELPYADDATTKDVLKDIESRMATKDDLKDLESRMVTKEYLKVKLSELENKMLKQQMIHSGIVIAAVGLMMAISKFIT